MLGIGDRFPDFSLTALVPGELSALEAKSPDDYFTKIDSSSYEGKWRVVFFWPKDFTFICPTEIAEFGRLNTEFADRDAQVLGGSVDNEFVHYAWRIQHEDLKKLPFPMLSDLNRELGLRPGRAQQRRRGRPGDLHRRPRGDHPIRHGDCRFGRSQRRRGAAGARRPADRRAVRLQLAQGSGDASTRRRS